MEKTENLSRKQKATKRVRETKGKKTDVKLQHACRAILVNDLRVGHEIGTVFGTGKYDEKVILKAKKVTDIVECPGKWRTHIHVNKQECYDTRQFVTIKA